MVNYSLQLYSTVNSVHSDEKMFNYGKCSRGMLFLSFSTQINLRLVFKMIAFGTHAWFESWMPLVNGCVKCALFNAVPNVYPVVKVVLWSRGGLTWRSQVGANTIPIPTPL